MQIYKNSFILLIVIFAFYVVSFLNFAYASSNPRLYFFYGQGCPHCAKQELFLDKLDQKYPNNKFERFEVYYNKQNQDKLQQIATELNVDVNGVPFTVIGDKYFSGFGDESTTGKAIEMALVEVLSETPKTESNLQTESGIIKTSTATSVTLPLLGPINLKNYSLPALAVMIGFLDGFNPCAMWVLLFLISVLIPLKDKRRRWLIGLTFIASSAFIYFLFMAAWLNLFLFIGYISWIKIIIGTFAIGAGSYFLKDYFCNKEGACKVVDEKERKYFFNQIKKIIASTNIFSLIIGIVLLAFSVNLIELVCSAGLPAIYTHVLSLSNLNDIQYYFYLILYVLFFMIDDILIFVVAMKTLEIMGIQKKYSRYSHLIGGILMLILGLLLIFKPEWLMFG